MLDRFGLLLLICTVAGCDTMSFEVVPPTGTPQSNMRTLTDNLGRTVTVPINVQRIVSLTPANTETLFAIGAGDRVVGVTKFANYPPEVADVSRVGGFASKSINMETVLGLQPDIVLTEGDMHLPLLRQFDHLGVPAIALDATSVDDVRMNVLLIGNVTGQNEEAKQVVDQMTHVTDAIATLLADLPDSDRRRVCYLAWDRPLMAAGQSSFIGQMIVQSHANNIFDDTLQPFPQVSEETLIRRDPDVILVPARGDLNDQVTSLATRSGWQQVSAVP